MRRFLLIRGLQSLLVLAIMSFVIYALIGLMPGDPIDLMISADPRMTAADAARLRALYGLDLPLTERYWNWLTAALSGDLGYSRLFGKPVLQTLLPALKNSLVLLGTAFLLAVTIAIPLGTLAAARPRSAVDYGINLFAFAGISIPSFWLALMLIIVFAVLLGWLPAGGIAPPGAGLLEHLRYMLLPALTLTIVSVGSYSRYTRSSMMEVLRQDYIRTARAKGASQGRVVWKHGLRNAMIPVVTILALDFGFLFSGALITETIFSWPGMGRTLLIAAQAQDIPMVIGALLFTGVLALMGHLFADVLYAFLDPRIRYS